MDRLAQQIIESHGKQAISHVLGEITQAVSNGDDVLVERLDALMQKVEAMMEQAEQLKP